MVSEIRTDKLLSFFKAMADANRLKIISLLSQEELSVEQLAEILQLSASTVSHHLAKLSRVGLVSAHPESYYNIYRLERKTLEIMLNHLLEKENLPDISAGIGLDAYDQKVIKNYTYIDGRLKEIPRQYKKLQAILRYVVKDFKAGIEYSEKEVNEILKHYNMDYAQLRRELVEFGLLGREGGGGRYWLIEKPKKSKKRIC